jgi:hypothetical protein
MSFEVPVERICGKRRRWGIPAVILGSAAIVGFALVAGGWPGNAPRPAAADAADADAPAASPASVARSQPRAIPADVRCEDIARPTCLRLAAAAMAVLPPSAPEVSRVSVWHSLLCNDNFDCPSTYLDGSEPLGSVLVSFADGGPRAAINVVDRRSGFGTRLETRAWVARWMPEAG